MQCLNKLDLETIKSRVYNPFLQLINLRSLQKKEEEKSKFLRTNFTEYYQLTTSFSLHDI